MVVDGGYAKKPLLKSAREEGFVVVGRLRKDAALWSLPPRQRRPGQRGPLPIYGKWRLDLIKRAGQSGWLGARELCAVPGACAQDVQDVPGDLEAGRGLDSICQP